MARSMFYKAAFERRFPLPFLFFEFIAEIVAAYEGTPTDVEMEKILKDSLKDCLGREKVTDDDLIYVAERLTAMAKQKDDDKKEQTPTKKSFASSYSTWVATMEPEQVCLVMAGFDYDLAKTLFSEVDKDDVMEMSAAWVNKSWEDIKIAYECCIYGFGGGYKSTGVAPGDTEVDVSTEDNAQGRVISPRALASVKF